MGNGVKAGSGVDVRASSIRITFTHNGKQERKTLTVNGAPMAPTSPNIRHAERLVAEIKEKIRLGSYDPGAYFPDEHNPAPAAARTVGEQLDLWASTKRIEATTKAGYASAIRFWKGSQYMEESEAELGDMPLSRLLHSHLLYVVADRDDLKGKTIKNYLGPLREAMALAVRDKVLDSDPSTGIKPPKYKKEDPDPLDAEQAEIVLNHLRAKHPGQVHNMAEFWCWSGLRTSELFGLRWGSIDLVAGTATIREVLIRGVEKPTTKTGIDREVILNSRAMAALQRQRQYTHLAGEEVFHDPRYDTRWNDERAFRRSFWAPTLKTLGIRYRRPYHMRHTYATRLLENQVNPAMAAKQLGHSIEMFLRTYSKWLGGKLDKIEMAKLEAGIKAAADGALSPDYPQKSIKGP
ncbi:site-specific integrase [Hydrogenophaga sp.]|uniref:site-specific integrase n=1 Tax=Hydrogenophaga sp. TaxID=1904254 RepID=UPI0027343C37|nr:site-specific integrase [Hydrogenophaga sp.]MDP2987116.1 tyrosine-type recombinase/integrase [Hydrogenophaga sp.]MDP3627256.1 tyrosine-type recombinase/integrase [Hydrogenophaga sp.]